MIPTTTAHDGLTLPVLGFGTHRLSTGSRPRRACCPR